jgi:ABC-type cobalamin/Fe3+-siderophores transport systems, ATPase components
MSLAGRDLTIGYSDRVVGRGLNVALERGEVLALLGPNGGGKTTLLKTLLGILAPRAGEVAVGGRSLAGISIGERARLIAYVPQVHVPTFAFTVDTVVLMGRTAHGDLFSRPSTRDRTVAARMLDQFGIAHLAPALYDDLRRRAPARAARPRARAGAAIHRARRADREPRLRQPGQGDAGNPRARGFRPRRAVHHARSRTMRCAPPIALIYFAAANGWPKAPLSRC